MTIKYLIQKEFLQIRRNSFMPKIIFIFPIMVMCVMPWVMNQEVKNIRVDVVDIDRTTQSQQLVHQIEASNYFIFNAQQPTYEAAMKDIETSKADIILEIRNGQYLIAANAVNGTKGSIGSSYLSQIVREKVIVNSEKSASAVRSPVGNSSLFTFIQQGAELQSLYDSRPDGHSDDDALWLPACPEYRG